MIVAQISCWALQACCNSNCWCLLCCCAVLSAVWLWLGLCVHAAVALLASCRQSLQQSATAAAAALLLGLQVHGLQRFAAPPAVPDSAQALRMHRPHQTILVSSAAVPKLSQQLTFTQLKSRRKPGQTKRHGNAFCAGTQSAAWLSSHAGTCVAVGPVSRGCRSMLLAGSGAGCQTALPVMWRCKSTSKACDCGSVLLSGCQRVRYQGHDCAVVFEVG